MNFLPLVSRELRVAVRRRNVYRVRMAVGGGSMSLSYWALLVWSGWQSGAALGHTILEVLSLCGFVGGALSGVFLTADCLSQERREGTLGLLFLTDLRAHDVVFGKLAAKMIVPFYCGLALVPALAICVIVGGVTGGEFWRMCLVLANTLFLSLSASLFSSSFCQKARSAYGVALLILLLNLGALPIAGSALSSWSNNSLAEHLSYLVSPMGTYLLANDKSYQSAAAWFWSSLIVSHVLAWLCLIAACIVLPWQWQDKGFSSPPQGSGRAAMRRRQSARQELLSANPIRWLVYRQHLKRPLIWTLPALAISLWFSFDLDPVGNRQSQMSFLALVAVHALFKIWLTADATHAFAGDRRSGALELLLGTPLSVRELVTGMLSAFRQRFQGPQVVLISVDLLLAARLLFAGNGIGALWTGVMVLMFLADAYCLGWVGLWRGLVDRNAALATLSAAGRVLIVPWILFGAGAGIFSQSTQTELALLWLVVCGMANLICLSHAKNGLVEHFRVLALRPFGAKAPHIESQWSAMNWESSDPANNAN